MGKKIVVTLRYSSVTPWNSKAICSTRYECSECGNRIPDSGFQYVKNKGELRFLPEPGCYKFCFNCGANIEEIEEREEIFENTHQSK